MHYLNISGTSKTIGEAIGEHFRNKIQEYTEYRYKQINDEYASLGIIFNRTDYYGVSFQLEQYAKKYAPDEYNELYGVAYAANLSFRDVLFAVGYTDIFDYLLTRSGHLNDGLFENNAECTTFIYKWDKQLLCGQNWDMDEGSANNCCFIKKHYSDGSVLQGLSTVVGLIHIGMSNKGVFIGTANLISKRNTNKGLVFPIIIQKLLRRPFDSEQLQRVRTVGKVGGHYYYIAQTNKGVGSAFAIECDAEECIIQRIEEGVYAHSNHYRRLAFQNEGVMYSSDSLIRCAYVENELNRPGINIDTIKKILSNHSSNICRHSHHNQFSRTCASVIFDGSKNTMQVCDSNPCIGRWFTILG